MPVFDPGGYGVEIEMNYTPPRIVVDLFVPNAKGVVTPDEVRRSCKYLNRFVRGIVLGEADWLTRHPNTPSIYTDLPTFRIELKPEDYVGISIQRKIGFVDCDDAVIRRLAELVAFGNYTLEVDCDVILVYGSPPDDYGNRMYHYELIRKDIARLPPPNLARHNSPGCYQSKVFPGWIVEDVIQYLPWFKGTG